MAGRESGDVSGELAEMLDMIDRELERFHTLDPYDVLLGANYRLSPFGPRL